MSLQVWLPLTKDLRNQGLSNVTVTNNGATFNSAGKLGGCYTFTNQTIVVTPSTDLKNSFSSAASLACWVKVSTSHAAYAQCMTFGTVSTAWAAIYFGIDIGSNGVPIGNVANGSNSTNCSFSTAIKDGKWHHLALTYESGTIKSYMDGVLKNTVSTSYIPAWANATVFSIGGNSSEVFKNGDAMNDVRLYNHCLSPMEIKELSKGLVLHYPLNRGGWGQENLLLNTNTPATWSQEVNSSNYAIHDCFKTQSPVPSLFSVDELITISFDWSTTATGGNFRVECGAVTPWIWGTIVSSKGTRSSASNYIDIASSNQSGHVEITFKITSSQTGAADTLQWLRIRHDGADTANKTFTISNAKLERGSIATLWCPNTSDAFATTMGLNGTTEYDCSGYCNNGTRTGTFEWTSDTPKYTVSTTFDASHPDYIKIPNANYAIQGAQEMTWSIWAYDNDWSTYSGRIYSCTEGGGMNIEDNGTKLNWAVNMYTAADHSTSAYQGYCAIEKSILTPGWHMFTWVYTTTGTKVYVDGVQKASVNITSYGIHFNTSAYLLLGAETSGGEMPTDGYYLTGKLSDFRIYATALSADDVKSLYQNSAYIDSDGNVYGAVHSEV